MAELAFLPFAGQGVQRRKETYPSWMKKAKYSQLSRTVVVTGLKNSSHRDLLEQYFAKTCGDGHAKVVQECEVVVQKDGSLHAYIRFRESTEIETDTGREQLVGSKAAFQAVYTHDDTRIDLSSSVVDVVLRVRPAVFNGLLWVGELPDNADDAMLESVVNMHGQGPPDLCKVACSQCHAQSKDWGLVQFSTDETAATVLVRSWDTLVCANRLPWPALMEAWAPGEGTNHKFSLGLPDLPPAPPHFVFVNTLKWEFAHQWRRVTLAHRAQCEALRGAQWRERHELMGRKRGSAERERWSEGARDSRSGVTKLKGSLFVAKMRCPRAEDEAGLRDSPDSEWLEMNQLKRMKEMVKNFMSKYGMVDICRVTADSAGGLYSAKVQFGGGGCVAVAEAAMASLNSGGGAVFGVGVSASPLLLDKTICITELDTDVHNAALAEAFGQFGKIVMSTVAKCDLTKRLLGWATIKWDDWRTGGLLLDIMEREMFCMQGSSLPILVEPFAPATRWSSKSPAMDVIAEGGGVRMVENTHVDFPAALSSRGLQVQHRDEKRWLAHRQASERRELEEQQQKRLKEEKKSMDTLDSVLKKITDAENEQKSRKRSYNDTIQAGGQGGGQVGCPWAQMRELWNGTFYLHIQEKQMQEISMDKIKRSVEFRFCATAWGAVPVHEINKHLPWKNVMTVLGVIGREEAVEDVRKKIRRTYFMTVSCRKDSNNVDEKKDIRELKALCKDYGKALILMDDQMSCGRLYVFDSSAEIAFAGLPKGCRGDSLMGALVIPSSGLAGLDRPREMPMASLTTVAYQMDSSIEKI